MKKLLFLAALVVAMTFASCNYGKTVSNEPEVDTTAVDSVVIDTVETL